MLRTRPRIDERAIVAGTTARFALLLLLVLVNSGSLMAAAFGNLFRKEPYGPDVCDLAAGHNPGISPLSEVDTTSGRYAAAYDACLKRYEPSTPVWAVIGWPILVVAVAVAVFWLLPVWKRRRGRMVALDRADTGGDIRRTLTGLAATAGLSRVPDMVIRPTALSSGAVVFGRTRRPVVCLDGGLLVLHATNPERFRAVVLHEFAHIANADTTVTYATVAVWRSFVVVVMVPFLVRMATILPSIGEPYGYNAKAYGVIVALLPFFLAALMYITRSDILRSREIFADLAAARWGADIGTAGHPEHSGTRPPATVRRRLSRLWRTHPEWTVRRFSLADPRSLFTVRALPMLLAGATAPTLVIQTSLYNSGIASSGWLGVLPAYLEFFVGAVFVVGVVGVALWRSVAYALATGRRVPSGVRAGFWFGLGLVAGQLVADQAVVSGFPPQPELFAAVFVFGMGFCVWFTHCTHAWLRAWRHRATIPVFVLIHVAAVFVLTQWFDTWKTMGVSFEDARDAGSYLASLGIGGTRPANLLFGWLRASDIAFYWNAIGPLTVLVFVLLPLLAWLLRPAMSRPGWALRVTGGLPNSTPWKPLPSVRAAIVSGVVGGVASVAMIAVTMAYLHGRRSESRPTFQNLFDGYTLSVAAALTAGAVLAAAIACRTEAGHEVPAAFASAMVSAITGLIGWNALSSVDGCVGPMNVLGTSCVWRPRGIWEEIQDISSELGATIVVASFAVAMAVSGFRSLRRPVKHAQPAAPAEPRRTTGTRLMVAALMVAAVGIFPVANYSLAPDPSSNTSVSPSPDVDPPSARTRQQQFLAWDLVGGEDLIQRLTTNSGHFEISMSGNGTISANKVLPYCANILSTARDADNFFPIPDPSMQRTWHTVLTQLDTAARNCERALNNDDEKLLDSAVDQVDGSFPPFEALIKELERRESPAGSPN